MLTALVYGEFKQYLWINPATKPTNRWCLLLLPPSSLRIVPFLLAGLEHPRVQPFAADPPHPPDATLVPPSPQQ